jgi:hypothetical protein
MRVEELVVLTLEYDGDDPVVVRPFGGQEGQGFGTGTGRATGRLSGGVRFANFPRRREDGVFLPELRGVLTTEQGPVLWELHGISLPPDERDRRHLVGAVRFCAEAPELRWLNDCVAVHEGELDLEAGVVRIPVWLCRPDRDG